MVAHFASMKSFTAACMMAPYFSLVYEDMFSKYRPWIPIIDLVAPTWKFIPFPTRGRQPGHVLHFLTDPLCYSKGKMPVRNVAVTERLRFGIEDNRVAERLRTPTLLLLGKQD
jgi:hypothetical protein